MPGICAREFREENRVDNGDIGWLRCKAWRACCVRRHRAAA